MNPYSCEQIEFSTKHDYTDSEPECASNDKPSLSYAFQKTLLNGHFVPQAVTLPNDITIESSYMPSYMASSDKIKSIKKWLVQFLLHKKR